jgi:hypothetical protein
MRGQPIVALAVIVISTSRSHLERPVPNFTEIDKYIAAHGNWKARLRQMITSGKSDVPVSTIRRDDQCEFGKWLHAASPDERRQVDFQRVMALHKAFHVAAARVAQLASSGNASEAEGLMGFNGEFAMASMALTRAMKEWKTKAAA